MVEDQRQVLDIDVPQLMQAMERMTPRELVGTMHFYAQLATRDKRYVELSAGMHRLAWWTLQRRECTSPSEP